MAGYSIETPRLLLLSASSAFPDGLGNDHGQVGRYAMVQGAPQTAGRFAEDVRMYKAPPPEVTCEEFYFAGMVEAEAVACLQIDVTRCGGFLEWMHAAAVAAAHGLQVSGHCAPNLHAHVAVGVPNLRHLT